MLIRDDVFSWGPFVASVPVVLPYAFLKEWGAPKAYPDYRALLADPQVDAVEVITPHHLHAPMGIAALQAGKHLSLQKPMAVSVAECDALIAAAHRAGKCFRVFENFRYYPPLVRAKELLEAGAIGEPLSIRLKVVQGSMGQGWQVPYSRWAWRFDPIQSGGGGSSSTTATTSSPSPCGSWARWRRSTPGSPTGRFGRSWRAGRCPS